MDWISFLLGVLFCVPVVVFVWVEANYRGYMDALDDVCRAVRLSVFKASDLGLPDSSIDLGGGGE